MNIKTKLKTFPCEELVGQQIRLNGPMNFHEFVDLALYHPQYGYYNTKKTPRGKSGDYFTSVQIQGLFQKIMADVILHLKEELQTEQFYLIEVGSGHGEFLQGVLDELSNRKQLKGINVWAVERSRPARDELWRRLSRFPKTQIISNWDDLDVVGGVDGLLFSNEFFDAIPFHRLRYRNGKWREINVQTSGNQLIEEEGDLASPDLLSHINLKKLEFVEGQEIEVRPDVSKIWEQWSGVLSRGYALTVDYGGPRGIQYSPHKLKGTWKCFYKHQLNENILAHIGHQDITANVDFSQIAEAGHKAGFKPEFYSSQGQFLTHVGRKIFENHLSKLQEKNAKSQIGAIQQLIHPDAMGEAFSVMIHTKEAAIPAPLHLPSNRLKKCLL